MSVSNDATNLKIAISGSKLNKKSQFFLVTGATGGYTHNWPTPGITHLVENTTLYAHVGAANSWNWSSLGSISLTKTASKVEATVPLQALGLTAGAEIRIGFVSADSKSAAYPAYATELPAYTVT
jgi:hypothetical protein